MTSSPTIVDHFFSANYAQARQRFLAAAHSRSDGVESFLIEASGSSGEALSTDVAWVRPDGARALLVLTSATHGIEGFCGSACQLALLADDDLLARAAQAGVALLLIHAVNPYGFSWLSRTNEDNVDLNRNAQSFDAPLPIDADYARLHPLLVPAVWPPTPENREAIAAYVSQHGHGRFRAAVSRGQYAFPEGLFFGGAARSASLGTLSRVLRKHGGMFEEIGWIDFHTGLGPWGHGEKIFAGRRDPQEVERAVRWWGLDVAVPFAGTSASADITGQVASLIYAACPDARTTSMALEFGTVPFDAMVDALRGEAWLRRHPDAPPAAAARIRESMRGAFFSDDPAWQGMVLGQSRVATLQALRGLEGR